MSPFCLPPCGFLESKGFEGYAFIKSLGPRLAFSSGVLGIKLIPSGLWGKRRLSFLPGSVCVVRELAWRFFLSREAQLQYTPDQTPKKQNKNSASQPPGQLWRDTHGVAREEELPAWSATSSKHPCTQGVTDARGLHGPSYVLRRSLLRTRLTSLPVWSERALSL